MAPVEVLSSGKIVLEMQKHEDSNMTVTSQETMKRVLKLRKGAVSRITEKVCNTEGEEIEETDNSVADDTYDPDQLQSVQLIRTNKKHSTTETSPIRKEI
jgi:hypothetical protein